MSEVSNFRNHLVVWDPSVAVPGEIVIIDIQGEIAIPAELQKLKHSMKMGTVEIQRSPPAGGAMDDTLYMDGDKALFKSGIKTFEGTVQLLPKPLMLLRPHKKSNTEISSDLPNLYIYSIIKKKILFDEKPIYQWKQGA
eukprot:GHVO01049489.1.p1 GENE.GHVO01049489.1~~GHVO01049489.1.p1  ORF type:complete len:139 (+),score=14.23 GHVO01049489.1:34-450(+)